jgi:hypothetical protein
MARSSQEIRKEIEETVKADPVLSVLDNPSSVSSWRLISFIISYAINKMEALYDALRIEINEIIARLKPHTLRWYAEKAKAFQFGFPLLSDSDQFDTTGYTTEQIELSKVVTYAAVVENQSSTGRTILRIKLAAASGDDLQPLSEQQLSSFRNYMARIKDAGVPLQIDSLPPDKIVMQWQVYYDPLILSASGSRLDGSDDAPVKKAIKKYLESLPFNGTYVLQYHIDFVQIVEGVVIAHIQSCSASYGLLPLNGVNVLYQPDAGYLRFENDSFLTINYIPQSAIQ